MVLYFNSGIYKVALGGTIYNVYYDPTATSDKVLRDVWGFNDTIDLDYNTIETFATPCSASDGSWSGFMVDYNKTIGGIDEFNTLLFIVDSDSPDTIESMAYVYITEYDEDTGSVTLRDDFSDVCMYVSDIGWCIGNYPVAGTIYESLLPTNSFGSSGTNVSKEFYKWFNNNASQITDGVVKGKWKFNESLTLNFPGKFETESDSSTIYSGIFITFINALSHGPFSAIALEVKSTKNDGIWRIDVGYTPADGDAFIVCSITKDGTEWYTDALGIDLDSLRTIEFTDAQLMEDWFYDWFIENSTPVYDGNADREENDAGGITYNITASEDAISTESNASGGLTYIINY